MSALAQELYFALRLILTDSWKLQQVERVTQLGRLQLHVVEEILQVLVVRVVPSLLTLVAIRLLRRLTFSHFGLTRQNLL